MNSARCLIVGPSWVGDMIMAQSLYRRLREQHPGIIIDVLAPAWSGGILARMPEVRRVIASPFAHGRFDWTGRHALARRLCAEKYDLAIVLPNSWKSALTPYFAGVAQRRGYLGEMRYGLLNDIRRLDKGAMPRLVQRYAALATQPGAGSAQTEAPSPCLQVNADSRRRILAKLELALDRPVLILCPGAEYGPAKRWPEAHYAELARAKRAEGWQIWLLGSEKDRVVTEAINRHSGNVCIDLAGRTTLEQVVDLMACARAVVSNDSGLMHVAAAVDVPVIALYGSSDPAYTPPLSDKAHIARLGLECSPCFQRECPLGHRNCLEHLPVTQVLTLLPAL
ncbi:lipopolysaccharide heptosyltransferase II [Candidatus Methylospira mobilis]|uniref:lipopolysaccharide heptosyltransferase II n=1 Tax=Candidatus Methylospira mobilis TaxID=1808979 RepID=UPI0028EA8041|nr:lipopolysaccharide heptosyltransferase II [Candidatus Methylospira mobilis]WNV06683.1 lipopolysaccharide heptosyltransferase II [Candidatus Methylospira mobilis]